MLLWIKLPHRATSALAREDPVNQHHLNYIDKLDVLGYHTLNARLQRYQLIGRTPVQTLLDPGGQSHGSTGAEFGRCSPVGTIGDLCSIWGSILLFWFRSRTLIVSG